MMRSVLLVLCLTPGQGAPTTQTSPTIQTSNQADSPVCGQDAWHYQAGRAAHRVLDAVEDAASSTTFNVCDAVNECARKDPITGSTDSTSASASDDSSSSPSCTACADLAYCDCVPYAYSMTKLDAEVTFECEERFKVGTYTTHVPTNCHRCLRKHDGVVTGGYTQDCQTHRLVPVEPTTSCYSGGITSSVLAQKTASAADFPPYGVGPEVHGQAYGVLVYRYIDGPGKLGCLLHRAALKAKPAGFMMTPLTDASIWPESDNMFMILDAETRFHQGSTYTECPGWEQSDALNSACYTAAKIPKAFPLSIAIDIDTGLKGKPLVYTTQMVECTPEQVTQGDFDMCTPANYIGVVQQIAEATLKLGQGTDTGCVDGFHIVIGNTDAPLEECPAMSGYDKTDVLNPKSEYYTGASCPTCPQQGPIRCGDKDDPGFISFDKTENGKLCTDAAAARLEEALVIIDQVKANSK